MCLHSTFLFLSPLPIPRGFPSYYVFPSPILFPQSSFHLNRWSLLHFPFSAACKLFYSVFSVLFPYNTTYPDHQCRGLETNLVYPFFNGTSKNIQARTISPLFIGLMLLLIIVTIIVIIITIIIAILYSNTTTVQKLKF